MAVHPENRLAAISHLKDWFVSCGGSEDDSQKAAEYYVDGAISRGLEDKDTLAAFTDAIGPDSGGESSSSDITY